jgi:hypothetical protein
MKYEIGFRTIKELCEIAKELGSDCWQEKECNDYRNKTNICTEKNCPIIKNKKKVEK